MRLARRTHVVTTKENNEYDLIPNRFEVAPEVI